jgi:hypothetical protein
LLYAAGLGNRTEKFQFTTLFSALLATVGGLLAISAKGTFTAEGSTADAIMYQGLSLLVGIFRLIMTQNWLGMEDPMHIQPKSSPLVLGARMIPVISVASFELSFITDSDYTGSELSSLAANPLAKADLLGLFAVIGLCYSVLVVAELQILQLSSATLIGFLVPCGCIAIASLPELSLWQTGKSMPPLLLIGIAVYAFAISLYFVARACCQTTESEAESNGYHPLEGGERERRHKKRSRGRSGSGSHAPVPAPVPVSDSPRMGSSPARGGGGVMPEHRDWM